MRLVYQGTDTEVKVGDIVRLTDDECVKVAYFREPHKPSSSGKVLVENMETGFKREYYVGVIGAHWIEREDRE